MLFHDALGLTPSITAFAGERRSAGHTVHTPDLFEGRTFDTIEEGVGYAQEIGLDEVIERGIRAVDDLPTELVYAGFSLGVVLAQKLAQTRPRARGALLFYSCVPVSEFGTSWRKGVPVQIHGMDADPYFVAEGDIDAARALVEEAEDGELDRRFPDRVKLRATDAQGLAGAWAMIEDIWRTTVSRARRLPEGLLFERSVPPPRTPGHPTELRSVLACLHVILDEEWEHSRYANRDLDVLESRDVVAG